MGEEMEEEGSVAKLKSQLSQINTFWKHEFEQHRSQVDILQAKLIDIKSSILSSEVIEKKESEVLWRRLKSTATLLAHLKSKARIMAVPHLAHTSCGIRHQEGVGLVDKNGTPFADWSKDVDLSPFETLDEEKKLRINNRQGSLDEHDGACIGEIFKSVMLVTDVMEGLVKRVIIAEKETAIEKSKVNLGLEEIKKKVFQIEKMSAKIEEMEKWALGMDGVLKEMRQKVEDMVQEASRQSQQAAENEQELCRMRLEFDFLRSNINDLVSVRDTLILSSEKQFQTMEKLFGRLMGKTVQLESEKTAKEGEIQKLMEENDRLSSLLDKKEAQLVAMNEQCKVMAMNSLGL